MHYIHYINLLAMLSLQKVKVFNMRETLKLFNIVHAYLENMTMDDIPYLTKYNVSHVDVH